MEVVSASLPEVLVITPRRFGDGRGYFEELYQAGRYAREGIDRPFVQDNLSLSSRGVLRGLHFQHPQGQGKLVTILQGAVFDVAVDVRVGSPDFGCWFGIELSGDNSRQLWLPPGFAHGFCVLSETALFHYKCTTYYDPDCEHSVRWNDPQLGIAWPIEHPSLSAKDEAAPCLADIDPTHLPCYETPTP